MKAQALHILREIHAAGGRTKIIQGKLSITPPDLAKRFKDRIDQCREAFLQLHRAIPSGQFEERLLEYFPGKVVVDDLGNEPLPRSEDEWTPERRLAAAAALLGRKDSKGRLDFTKSEIDSTLIGLRCCADEPGVAEMVETLKDARKNALDWSSLARRISADRGRRV